MIRIKPGQNFLGGEDGGITTAGLLLVAHPNLKDPNFRRRVLYLIAHTTEGALGVILNVPLGRSAHELLPTHQYTDSFEDIPVYVGGPVGGDQLSFAEMVWPRGSDKQDEKNGLLQIRHNLSPAEIAELVAKHAELPASEQPAAFQQRLRAFVGYAGWSSGQLEQEIAQNAWILVQPHARLFLPRRYQHKPKMEASEENVGSGFSDQLETTAIPSAIPLTPDPKRLEEDRTWFHIMSELGPLYKLLGAAPDNPSLN